MAFAGFLKFKGLLNPFKVLSRAFTGPSEYLVRAFKKALKGLLMAFLMSLVAFKGL